MQQEVCRNGATAIKYVESESVPNQKELNGRYEKNCNFASKPGDRSLPATVEFYSSRLLWSRRNHPAHNLQHKF